jgi:large subunit ribosomal protein L10
MSLRTYPGKKVTTLSELEGLIKQSGGIYLADFSGLNTDKMNELRDMFYQHGAQLRVAKNTLTKIALHNCGIKDLDPFLTGQTVLAFSGQDPAEPARIILDFVRQNEKPVLKGCYFEGSLYGPEKLSIIRNLPTREEALAQLLGQIQAPLSGFVGVLNEILRGFLATLDAIIQKKVEQK